MADNFNVTTEQVDDIPVLMAQGKKIGIPELLDRHFAPHGNWQGTSFGWTGLVWLSHILSEGDHRLNQAEAWAEKRLRTLGASIGQMVRGGSWHKEKHGFMSLPLMARPGSVIPLGSVDTRTDYDYLDHVGLHVFALEDGREASVTIPALDGSPAAAFTFRRAGDTLNIATTSEKPYEVFLHNMPGVTINQ